MADSLYAVIMAGGKGERFWPLSRAARPKQLLSLTSSGITLLEETCRRLDGLVTPEHILVLTGMDYVGQIRMLLKDVPPQNIVGEPVRRDTAPCAALAAGLVAARGGESILLLSADAAIRETELFREELRDMLSMLRRRPQTIYTIGVPPSFAATNYGYIECGEPLGGEGETQFFDVLRFREKPDPATAQKFVAAGNFLWNSGIFLFSVENIRNEMRAASPRLFALMNDCEAAERRGELVSRLPELFAPQQKLSLDYAIMEHAASITVAKCRFSWSDLGSFDALGDELGRDADGNAAQGNFIGVDAKGVVSCAPAGHLVAAVGVEDLYIVNTPDATLVCRRGDEAKIKQLLAALSADAGLKKHL